MRPLRLSLCFVFLVACSGGNDGTAGAPAGIADGGSGSSSSSSGGGDGDGGDGTPPAPKAEYWLKALPMEFGYANVIAHPDGGGVVYGRRLTPTAGAFAARFDRYGTESWSAALGEGYVARMSPGRNGGYWATGSRTTNYKEGLAGAFFAKVGFDGAVTLQTEVKSEFSAYARGVGIGEGADGSLTFVGLAPTSVASGWDVLVAHFSSAGAKLGENVFGKYNYVDIVGDAIVDADGNAYALVSGGHNSGLTKLSPAGEEIWVLTTHSNGRLAFDGAGNVLRLYDDEIRTFTPAGEELLPMINWTTDPTDDSYGLAVGPEGQIAVAGSTNDGHTPLLVVRDTAGNSVVRVVPFASYKYGSLTGVAFDKDGGLMVAGTFQGKLVLESTNTTLTSDDTTYFVARIPRP